jgi:uncharacterized membrane protein
MVAAMTLHGRGAYLVVAALAISLLANVFAASFILGQWFSNTRPEAVISAPRYPQPIRSAAREALRENRGELIPALVRLRRARLAMFDAARAAEFEPATLEAAMAEVRSATTAVQAIAQGALAKAIRGASPQDRATIRPPERFNVLTDGEPPSP